MFAAIAGGGILLQRVKDRKTDPNDALEKYGI
jgi:hypothetical protein